MKRKHRTITALLALLTAALLGVPLLAACGGDSGSDGGPVSVGNERRLEEVSLLLQNGDTVRCIKYRGYGITCDWDHVVTSNG